MGGSKVATAQPHMATAAVAAVVAAAQVRKMGAGKTLLLFPFPPHSPVASIIATPDPRNCSSQDNSPGARLLVCCS